MVLDTAALEFAKFASTNLSDASFPSLIPTTTEPTGDGVIEMIDAEGEGHVGNCLQILPFGTGADNTTFDLRVTGWTEVPGTALTTLWVPVHLATLSCTLSATVGVAGTPVLGTERLVDTITVAATFTLPDSVKLISPTGNLVGYVLVDVIGHKKVQISVDMTGATNANALYRKF